MRTSIISLAFAVVIGLVIGLLLRSPDTVPTTIKPAAVTATKQNDVTSFTPAETTDSNLNEIAQQLQQEIVARKNLQAQVRELDEKITLLEKQKNSPAKPGSTTLSHNTALSPGTSSPWFNQQALIDAGIDASEIQRLKERFEKQELETLYLRDKAVREDWLGTRRYREELQALEAQAGNMKEELDEEAYAAYLFASGQSNRVSVQSVLTGSAANNSGILPDDHILRYDNQRIYNWRDLRNATTQGDINETITIEVMRNNKRMEFYVQRGPLGIRMSPVSVAP